MAVNDNAPKQPTKAERDKAEADAKALAESQAKAKTEALEAFNDAQLEALNLAGFGTLEALDLATDDELEQIPGVSKSTITAFRKNQEARGVTPPSNDPPAAQTLVDSGIPISDTVSVPDVRNTNPNLTGTPLSELEPTMSNAPDKCPNCGGKLIPYLGDNVHKVGTAECVQCHTRHGAPRATVRV